MAYLSLVLVSGLDAVCTWFVLHLGGIEVNPIADAVLYTHGFGGLTMFKFLLVTLVIVCCEEIGRRNRRTGFRLVLFGVMLTMIPVLVALSQISAWVSAHT